MKNKITTIEQLYDDDIARINQELRIYKEMKEFSNRTDLDTKILSLQRKLICTQVLKAELIFRLNQKQK